MPQNIYEAIAKFGTVLVDRRFWMFVISVILSFTAIPYLADNQEQVAADVSGAVSLIFQGVTVLFGMLKLIDSWEKRPPSGLEYRKISKTLDELQAALKDAGINL